MISDAIITRGIDNGYTVKRFITGSQKRSEGDINLLYRITVPYLFNEQIFRDIRTIGVFGVKIEKMKNENIVQCHNCQRYSHTARLCSFAFRCVKCCSTHPPGNRPRNNTEIPVACINCYEHGFQHLGHSANQYNTCRFYLQSTKANNQTESAPNQ